MYKDIIEIKRQKKHILGYACFNELNVESKFVFDCLVEWSQQHPERKIYRHSIERKEENIGVDGKYDVTKSPTYSPENGGWLAKMGGIPYCDLVYYLDIYWQ